MEANASSSSPRSPLAIGNFPTEIAFEILDKLFMEGPELTHTALCSLRCLSLADEASAIVVQSYLRLRPPSQRLERALNFQVFSYAVERGRLHREGPSILTQLPGTPIVHPSIRSAEEDIVTSTILDGCADCFDWLRAEIPQLSRTSVNPHGWSYVGLALYAGSVHALKYFLDSASDPADFMFCMIQHFPACVYQYGPSHFDLMTEKRDLPLLKAVVDTLEPFFLASPCQMTLSNLRPESQFNICSFATPKLAERLQKNFAMLLTDRSIWHGAVLNGPRFLDYLFSQRKIPQGDYSRVLTHHHDGRTPLGLAMDRNLVDSARWLVENYVFFDMIDRRCFEIDVYDEIKLATMANSPASVRLLQILLSVTPSHHKIFDLPISLLGRLIVALHQELRASNAAGHGAVAFWDAREAQENIAIQKCEAIITVARAFQYPCLYHGSEQEDHSRRAQALDRMKDLLEELGSEKLSRVIENACSCPRWQQSLRGQV
ncbi:hypothetical protein N7492_009602 [Penicillium capsulatum]|uniref:Uncharacterized protein n=1 Tax=Penicillium capsulatum TaxID=69766 RepID=A0A9W9HXG3_9EURO|nr:hypothetical protein N7492_009602 [Penicillium capsulatum]KAJ6106990.1 hypothetical protein N7512_010507 [Penicillium capsulatum]